MSSFPFFAYQPPTEEQIATMRLSNESFVRSVMSYMGDEQSKEQLFTLLAILSLVNESPRMNGYFSGIVTGALTTRFDMCFCRGSDMDNSHTRESHFEMGEDTESEQSTTEPAPDLPRVTGKCSECDNEIDALPCKYCAFEVTDPGPPPEAPLETLSEEKILELEDTYKLDHSDVKGDTRVRCRRCGMQYPSLQDRMLRGPGECSGCEQAEKNGNWLDRWA